MDAGEIRGMRSGRSVTPDAGIDGVHHRNLTLGTVYKITSPSGKGYVGQTIQKLECRMKGHSTIDEVIERVRHTICETRNKTRT